MPQPLESFAMSFSGRLLARGFWLYVWDVRTPKARCLYVGRTGDSASPFASSPFRRIGQHLEMKPNAKGNALARQPKAAGFDCSECTFEMIAIGPLFPEQKTWKDHLPIRDHVAALERSVADDLRLRGYWVVGTHPPKKAPDEALMSEIRAILFQRFPVTQNERLCSHDR